MAALKGWVTAADSQQFSRLPEGVVSVNISHSNITARMIELKFDLSQTVRMGIHGGLVARLVQQLDMGARVWVPFFP